MTATEQSADDPRRARGRRSHASGLRGEAAAEAALIAEGWITLGRRCRLEAGEIDLVCEKDGLVAFIEVKTRPDLAGAACAVTPRQQRRLLAAAETLLAANPDWGANGVRFDLLVVDRHGRVRRIADAFRADG